jgi:hypothetical protein
MAKIIALVPYYVTPALPGGRSSEHHHDPRMLCFVVRPDMPCDQGVLDFHLQSPFDALAYFVRLESQAAEFIRPSAGTIEAWAVVLLVADHSSP